MTDAQREALRALSERYHVPFVEENFHPQFDLPDGWVAGWIGDTDRPRIIYVGCDPDGVISS